MHPRRAKPDSTQLSVLRTVADARGVLPLADATGLDPRTVRRVLAGDVVQLASVRALYGAAVRLAESPPTTPTPPSAA